MPPRPMRPPGPLTALQRRALEATWRGTLVLRQRQFGWRKWLAWHDYASGRDFTDQEKALFERRLIRWTPCHDYGPRYHRCSWRMLSLTAAGVRELFNR